MNLNLITAQDNIRTSVPCRVDFGGTLDISTFYLPLASVSPSSFNIALDMRTHVTLSPFDGNKVKVSSKGFEDAVFERNAAPFNHPMGLMFAIAAFFNAHGVHIHIESTSPPKSALGGSSSAAVAVISAFFKCFGKEIDPQEIVWLAHYIEASVAGVPCGIQDQLAAAFGGVHHWGWRMGKTGPEYDQNRLFETHEAEDGLNAHIIVAYCGIPHVSKDINQQWVNAFVRGSAREEFIKIAGLTNTFCTAVKSSEYGRAGELMNEETRIRLEMTPQVLDNTGKKLFEKAEQFKCGARFTGAGGGGCLWAIGEKYDISRLKSEWQDVLDPVEDGKILDTRIDHEGIIVI